MGLSPRQLATRISVKPSTVEKWEQGDIEPRASKLTLLAGILGVPVLWLLNGEMPAEVDHDPRPSQTATAARKLNRAIAMQGELAALLLEVSADLKRLQRDFKGAARAPRDEAA